MRCSLLVTCAPVARSTTSRGIVTAQVQLWMIRLADGGGIMPTTPAPLNTYRTMTGESTARTAVSLKVACGGGGGGGGGGSPLAFPTAGLRGLGGLRVTKRGLAIKASEGSDMIVTMIVAVSSRVVRRLSAGDVSPGCSLGNLIGASRRHVSMPSTAPSTATSVASKASRAASLRNTLASAAAVSSASFAARASLRAWSAPCIEHHRVASRDFRAPISVAVASIAIAPAQLSRACIVTPAPCAGPPSKCPVRRRSMAFRRSKVISSNGKVCSASATTICF